MVLTRIVSSVTWVQGLGDKVPVHIDFADKVPVHIDFAARCGLDPGLVLRQLGVLR